MYNVQGEGMSRVKTELGHANLILCCSGQKAFQAGSVGRLNNDNNSHVISVAIWVHVAESQCKSLAARDYIFHALSSVLKCSSPAQNTFVYSAKCH